MKENSKKEKFFKIANIVSYVALGLLFFGILIALIFKFIDVKKSNDVSEESTKIAKTSLVEEISTYSNGVDFSNPDTYVNKWFTFSSGSSFSPFVYDLSLNDDHVVSIKIFAFSSEEETFTASLDIYFTSKNFLVNFNVNGNDNLLFCLSFGSSSFDFWPNYTYFAFQFFFLVDERYSDYLNKTFAKLLVPLETGGTSSSPEDLLSMSATELEESLIGTWSFVDNLKYFPTLEAQESIYFKNMAGKEFDGLSVNADLKSFAYLGSSPEVVFENGNFTNYDNSQITITDLDTVTDVLRQLYLFFAFNAIKISEEISPPTLNLSKYSFNIYNKDKNDVFYYNYKVTDNILNLYICDYEVNFEDTLINLEVSADSKSSFYLNYSDTLLLDTLRVVYVGYSLQPLSEMLVEHNFFINTDKILSNNVDNLVSTDVTLEPYLQYFSTIDILEGDNYTTNFTNYNLIVDYDLANKILNYQNTTNENFWTGLVDLVNIPVILFNSLFDIELFGVSLKKIILPIIIILLVGAIIGLVKRISRGGKDE